MQIMINLGDGLTTSEYAAARHAIQDAFPGYDVQVLGTNIIPKDIVVTGGTATPDEVDRVVRYTLRPELSWPVSTDVNQYGTDVTEVEAKAISEYVGVALQDWAETQFPEYIVRVWVTDWAIGTWDANPHLSTDDSAETERVFTAMREAEQRCVIEALDRGVAPVTPENPQDN